MAPKSAPKKEEVGAGRASRKAPAPRLMPVKQEAVEDDEELVDVPLKTAPVKRQRVKKDEAVSSGPSEVLDLKSDTVQSCKKQQQENNSRSEPRAEQTACLTFLLSFCRSIASVVRLIGVPDALGPVDSTMQAALPALSFGPVPFLP